MDIIVQQVSTECFWDGEKWVPEMDHATPFKSAEDAIAACIDKHLRGIRLVFRFGDPQNNIFSPRLPEVRLKSPEEAKTAALMTVYEALQRNRNMLQSQVTRTLAEVEALQKRLKLARKAAGRDDQGKKLWD